MRAGSAPAGSPSVTDSENRRKTSYGVATPPYPILVATRSRAAVTGANNSATAAVANTARYGLGESVRPTSAPPPSTTVT